MSKMHINKNNKKIYKNEDSPTSDEVVIVNMISNDLNKI
jgi:hypothetical protein